jgi:2-C-methyl-D-erythritol 2,4-cyclodiphosphate synthase
MTRTGIGYDSHRFAAGRRLVLGGVTIPHPEGLAGHSDADVVAHALTDAILGAAGAGSIGALFPDTDARWKDADSIVLLREAYASVRARGFTFVHCDVTVIAEEPKIGPHAAAMSACIAQALGASPGDVNVKGKTNEGMGFIGRREGMAAIAVATLEQR